MTALAAVRHELDRLAGEGREIGLWWRDDDAVETGPALERLLALSRDTAIPLGLAVIPAKAKPGLSERLRSEDAVTVLVHGWRHANHAAPGESKSEFGAGRDPAAMARDAAAGRSAIENLFGARARAVFAPPWNRIAPGFARRLPALGYVALSCFGERPETPGIARIDTHLDPVDWHGSRSLAAPEELAVMIRDALARGAGSIGLLTHHAMFDASLWRFCEELATLATSHPALRREGIDDLLPAPTAAREAATA